MLSREWEQLLDFYHAILGVSWKSKLLGSIYIYNYKIQSIRPLMSSIEFMAIINIGYHSSGIAGRTGRSVADPQAEQTKPCQITL